MIISYCIPCHNRTHDLKAVMPSLIEAANFSPPVEIMILDYNSPDDLADYITHVMKTHLILNGSILSYKKYTGSIYFRIGHARNLSMLASKGKFLLAAGTDFYLDKSFFKAIRELLGESDCVWLCPPKKGAGIYGFDRTEFVEAGGYDERFDYYGKEDKDIIARLIRRGKKFKTTPMGTTDFIYTTKIDKCKNVRPGLSRRKAEKYTKAIYDKNNADKVLVANLEGWGKWEE